eukprot:scaffold23565_cov71-Phaeocystis_antarctica.AAC.2
MSRVSESSARSDARESVVECGDTAGLCGVLATWRVWCSSSYYYLPTLIDARPLRRVDTLRPVRRRSGRGRRRGGRGGGGGGGGGGDGGGDGVGGERHVVAAAAATATAAVAAALGRELGRRRCHVTMRDDECTPGGIGTKAHGLEAEDGLGLRHVRRAVLGALHHRELQRLLPHRRAEAREGLVEIVLRLAQSLRGERPHVAEALELLERVCVKRLAPRREAVGFHLEQPPPLVALSLDTRLGGAAPLQHTPGGRTNVLGAGQ